MHTHNMEIQYGINYAVNYITATWDTLSLNNMIDPCHVYSHDELKNIANGVHTKLHNIFTDECLMYTLRIFLKYNDLKKATFYAYKASGEYA